MLALRVTVPVTSIFPSILTFSIMLSLSSTVSLSESVPETTRYDVDSTVNPDVRVRVADNLLREHGYFSGFSEYELVPNKKNPRKAALRYKITMNHPYTFDSIAYINLHRRTDSIVKANLGESYLKKNDNFNAGNLDSERSRISLLLRDNGYYYYRPDFITYQADTFLTAEQLTANFQACKNNWRDDLAPNGMEGPTL